MPDMQTTMGSAEQGLARIRAAIARAESDFQRPAGSVTLVAVSKTVPAARIAETIVAGQRVFGENRVQEGMAKFPALRTEFGPLTLHLIGPLQTNKVREAVATFDVIETVDREKLAAALAAEIARTGKAPRLMVQVNTGAEPQKAGVLPEETPAFVQRCRVAHGLTIEGLMCIPPADQPPSAHFGLLAKLAKQCGLAQLSMGMSADFEAAIQLGATHVRVGSAIFGHRTAAPADALHPETIA